MSPWAPMLSCKWYTDHAQTHTTQLSLFHSRPTTLYIFISRSELMYPSWSFNPRSPRVDVLPTDFYLSDLWTYRLDLRIEDTQHSHPTLQDGTTEIHTQHSIPRTSHSILTITGASNSFTSPPSCTISFISLSTRLSSNLLLGQLYSCHTRHLSTLFAPHIASNLHPPIPPHGNRYIDISTFDLLNFFPSIRAITTLLEYEFGLSHKSSDTIPFGPVSLIPR